MKEVQIVGLRGKGASNWEYQINEILKSGWKIIGTTGWKHQYIIFERDIIVKEKEEKEQIKSKEVLGE